MTKSKFWGAFLFLVIFVGAFAYLGTFAHPSADDYSYSMMFKNSGFWGAQLESWHNWTSRFTTVFIIHVGNLLNFMNNYHWLAIFWLSVSFVAILMLISTLFPRTTRKEKIFLSLLGQSAWLATAPALNETLYWFCGAPYYYTSAILLLEFALIVRVCREIAYKWSFALLCLLVVINSGISELTAAYQMFMFAFATLVCWLSSEHEQREATKYMLILLGVSLVCLLAQVFHGGNSARSAVFEAMGTMPKSLVSVVKVMLYGGAVTLFEFFAKPIMYVVLLFVPFIAENVRQLSFVEKLPFRLRLWHIIAFEILTACGFQAIGGYAVGGALPPRAVGTVIWIMAVQWVFFFVFCYRDVDFIERIRNLKIFRWRAVLLASCFVLSGNFLSLISDYRVAPDYARQLNDRYAFITEQKTKGNFDVVVHKVTAIPKLLFLADITETIKDWTNEPYAAYFGLDTIRALPSELVDVARRKDAKRETEKAIELAKTGNIACQIYLARLYDPRIGDFVNDNVPKDGVIALSWYIKATEQGDDNAMQRMLSGLHRRGFGTPDSKPDYIEAIKWYLRSLW